jgi:molybdopterin-guanine dinucleotide biosynthesis protein A
MDSGRIAWLSCAVLAGGRSLRMGTDKALVDFDGLPMLQRVLSEVTELSDDVLVIGDRPEYHRFGAKVVADTWPNCGALGGIATALAVARHEWLFVAACDMPLLSAGLVRAMAAKPRDYDVLIPARPSARSRQGGAETLETMHAIYSRRCLSVLQSRLESGDLKVVSFMRDVRVRRLDERWLRRHDPALMSLINANSAAELDAARQLVRTSRDAMEG